MLSASWSTRSRAIRCESVSAVERAFERERRRDVRAPLEGRELTGDRVRQRLLEERAGLERVREIAQIAVQLAELRLEIGETAEDSLAALPVEQPLDLVAQQPQVLSEHVHLLQRPVVEVEAEADEESLVRLCERQVGHPTATRIRR